MRSRVRSSRLLVAVALVVLVGGSALGAAACGGSDGEAATDVGGGVVERKITVAGDSISVGLGSQLRGVLAGRTDADGVVVKVIGVEGTGLARPDSFDWPARVRELAADYPPDVLAFSVGSNDAQDLTDADGDVVVTMSDHDGWDAEYSRRLAEVFDAFAPADGEDPSTRVVWVGHVRTADDTVGATNRRIHGLAAAVAADRPWVEVADLGQLLGTGDAEATRCLVGDGVHLTVECLTEADEALAPQLLASN